MTDQAAYRFPAGGQTRGWKGITMMAIFAPLLFLFAFAFACATIAAMLASHGGKMMAALRMDHGHRVRRIAVHTAPPTIAPPMIAPVRRGLPMRAVRRPVAVGALRAA